MKILPILTLILHATLMAAPENPAVPGSTYTGTDDAKVFKMLIFSCFQNCNEKYFESMWVPAIDQASVPNGGIVPAIPGPVGKPLDTIRQLGDTQINPDYLYPGLKNDTELLQLEAKLPKEGNAQLSFKFTATLLDGSFFLLRPIYLKKDTKPAAADQKAETIEPETTNKKKKPNKSEQATPRKPSD